MNASADLKADDEAAQAGTSPNPAKGDQEGAAQAIVFLGRLLGTPIQKIQLQEGLSLSLRDGWSLDALTNAVNHAGLSASLLPAQAPRRNSEMPALVVGSNGRCVVALHIGDRGVECHLPGVEGSTWLNEEALAAEVPDARWLAVRAPLHFDQRSLLYHLPQVRRWFWDTFNRNRWIYMWALAGTVVLNIFGALIPFYTMAVYDRVIPHNALNSLAVLTIAVLALNGFDLVMRLLRSQLLEVAARRIDVALSSRIFAQCLSMRAVGRPASGGVLANTVRDFESVRDFFATGTLAVLGDLPFVLLYLGVIFLVGGQLGFVPLAFIPLLLGVSLIARKPLARRVNEGMQESSQRTAHLFETMNGLDTVKALGAEAWSRRKWESLSQAIAENNLHTREITSRMNYVNTVLLGLANVAVVATGAVMMSDNALTVGQIIAVSLLTGRALAPVSQIASLLLRWEQTKLSLVALDKVMAAPTDASQATLQAPALTGRIELNDLTFAYPKQPPLINGLNLRIAPGERVGIIGKLGSGKSTILKLLLNQFEPSAGSVTFDGVVHTHMDPLSLRRQIGYVPQDVTLFHGSLRENIELGRVQVDDSVLLDAVRNACLDGVLNELPEGAATQVGERGERLSGGQRQLVAIARALLLKPRVLLMDEPSSMVDPATEQRLITRLRALPDTTLVLVTHRMAMLAMVDRLLVMDGGKVIADGPRDQVLKALARQQQQSPDRAAPIAGTPDNNAKQASPT